MDTAAQVVGIYTAAADAAPMRSQTAATVTVGLGIEGDRYALGTGHYSTRPRDDGGRELTMFASETYGQLLASHGIRLQPGEARRNIETSGLELDSLLGRRFHIGPVLLEAVDRCPPCRHLEEITGAPVLAALLDRGGLRVAVRRDGTIRVGDPIVLVD